VRLNKKLNDAIATRLQPLPNTIEPPMPAPAWRGAL
jgi:hypothetical protein